MGSNNNQKNPATGAMLNAYGGATTQAPLSGSVQRNGPNPYQMDPRNGPIPGVGTMPNPGLGPSFNSSIMQNMKQSAPQPQGTPWSTGDGGGQTTQPVPNPPGMSSQGPQIQSPNIPPNASPQDIQTMMNQLNTSNQASGGGNPQMGNISNMVSALQGPSPLQQGNPQMGQIGVNAGRMLSQYTNPPQNPSQNPQMSSGNQPMGGMSRGFGGMNMGQRAANPYGNYMQQFQRKPLANQNAGIGPSPNMMGGMNQ